MEKREELEKYKSTDVLHLAFVQFYLQDKPDSKLLNQRFKSLSCKFATLTSTYKNKKQDLHDNIIFSLHHLAGNV